MQIAFALLATVAFLILLATSILTGFDIIPFNMGTGVVLAAFLLGVMAIALVFYQPGDANGDS